MAQKKKKSTGASPSKEFKPEVVNIEVLKPHPRNYREHPEDQIEHIIESIKEHGIYKNIIVAKEFTLLAGHGVWIASLRMGLKELPVIKLDLDPDDPRALKILTGDNEIGGRGEINDRLLSEILKEIKDEDDVGLLGTGYDERMLANLIFITRPASEVKDFDEAAHWVGMPDYEPAEDVIKVIVSFDSEADRKKFMKLIDVNKTRQRSQNGKVWSIWWPDREREDLQSVRWEEVEA
jgi:hypothetical protein